MKGEKKKKSHFPCLAYPWQMHPAVWQLGAQGSESKLTGWEQVGRSQALAAGQVCKEEAVS